MSNDLIAVIGFIALFVLMMLRVPVGMAMGLVGVTGYSVIVGPGPALKLVGQTSLRTVTDYTFGVIPMFMLMGAFVSVSGLSREMFKAADAFLGHLRGGLGIATVVACGGFAAICGSSVATAATFSTVAYPEMRRFGYPQSFSTGVIAAGGTLGAMLPPSTVLAVYAILTQQDIGKLFMAGVLPGLLAMGMYVLTIALIVRMYLGPGCLMDAMAMIIRTIPIIFPVVTALGFDPIWFGIIIVMTVELGLIHPPVGMNVFVIKSVVKDVNFTTIFKGVLPFVATDIVRLVILIAFPAIALWLPRKM